MKTLILAGGFGTRLAEETNVPYQNLWWKSVANLSYGI